MIPSDPQHLVPGRELAGGKVVASVGDLALERQDCSCVLDLPPSLRQVVDDGFELDFTH